MIKMEYKDIDKCPNCGGNIEKVPLSPTFTEKICFNCGWSWQLDEKKGE